MKVAIFETEHFEGAFPVIRLFDMPGNEITIYTTAQTHKRFLDLFGNSAAKYRWAILPARGKLRFFAALRKKLKELKPDILYINTISSNHLLYGAVLWLVRIKRTILTVHDINCLFESRSSLNFRQAVIHRGKKRLIERIDEFNVVADTMIPYLQSKAKKKRLHNIPGSVFDYGHVPQTIGVPLRVVIPGSLDKRRRDYEQAFELIKLAEQNGIAISLVLLGGYSDAYGKSIAERTQQFTGKLCSIGSYHTPVVDQEEFDKQMNAAHFVFIPSVINTQICDDIPEIYGITKSSGNIFDVIKHAKPFIVPEGLTISTNLQTSCFKYKTCNDIIDFIRKLISSPGHYDYWQNNAIENSRNYTIEKIREKNSSLFRQE